MTDSFQDFDYSDPAKNLKVYGQETPPSFDLKSIKVPVALMIGVNDTLATLADNLKLRRELNPESLVFFKSYVADHISMILGNREMAAVLNKDLIQLLEHAR